MLDSGLREVALWVGEVLGSHWLCAWVLPLRELDQRGVGVEDLEDRLLSGFNVQVAVLDDELDSFDELNIVFHFDELWKQLVNHFHLAERLLLVHFKNVLYGLLVLLDFFLEIGDVFAEAVTLVLPHFQRTAPDFLR